MNTPLLQPMSDDSSALALASALDADLQSDGCGPQLVPRSAVKLQPSLFAAGAVAPLADLALLRVHGADAVSFLQGQLTNDVAGLAQGQSMLAAYCSAKGRMLASMRVWREGPDVWLMPSRALAQGLAKRLSMFVLRAKVKIEDQSSQWAYFGLSGEQAVTAASALGLAWPQPGELTTFDRYRFLGLEPSGSAEASAHRALLVTPSEDAGRIWRELAAKLSPLSSIDWRWTEVMSGVGRIVATGVERFVPQMLNFDLVNGVSFRKGCYPGQEVVARSHYLGKLKRRMFLGAVSGEPPPPGADIFDGLASDPCGEVVLSAPSPQGGAVVLFECQIASAERARLSDERTLSLLSLPYSFPTA